VKAPRSAAARRTLELWRDSPRSARVHTTIRWWTAPFEALEWDVPREGDVLEIGCGHGVLSTYLALTSPSRRVLGIDIDGEKVALARHAVARLGPDEGHVRIEHRPSGEVPRIEGGWQAIVFADVLYLTSPEGRKELLAECVDALAPGGSLIVKEVDTRPRLKAVLAQVQEFVSTRVIRITHGEEMDFPTAAELESVLEDLGLDTRARRIDQGYLHPHCVVIGVKPRDQNSVAGSSESSGATS
jgi:2-polyprenyl-3-methyl-5-hydroxy-6-metoxy-1,4-benzoquinol methylase